MRTAYLVALSVLALLLAMCAGCDHERDDDPQWGIALKSCVITPRPDDPTRYEATITVIFTGGDFMQEVSVQDVPRWHEHFAFGDWQWVRDNHVVYEGERRQCIAYPAKVEGAWYNEYRCALIWMPVAPSNHPFFAQPVGGTVTWAARERAIVWTIDCRPDGVEINLQGRRYWRAR